MPDTRFNIFVHIRSFTRKLTSGMKAADRTLQKFQGNLANFEKRTQITATATHKLGMKFKQFTQTFHMWALGVMFFGMAIQRVFMRILKWGVSTFTQIQESMGFTGSALQQLSAMFKYLGVVVGGTINRYLTPLLPWIWKNLRAIKRWIEDNPKLTAKIILWGLAIGTVLMVIGMLVLGLSSLITMFTKIGVVLKFLVVGFMFFAKILAGILGIAVGWAAVILAAVIALVLAIIFNWFHLRDIIVAVLKIIVDTIVVVAETLLRLFIGFLHLILGNFKAAIETWKGIGKAWSDWWTSFYTHVKNIIGWIIEDIMGVIEKAKAAWAWLTKVFTRDKEGVKGSRQFGGPIPSTGLYQLHAGEYVVPANKTNNFGGINVRVNTTGGVNGNQVAREILKEIKRYTNVYID